MAELAAASATCRTSLGYAEGMQTFDMWRLRNAQQVENMNMLMNNHEYLDLVQLVKQEIRQAQYKATLSVNRELIVLYHSIGRLINEHKSWGNKFIDNLAADIRDIDALLAAEQTVKELQPIQDELNGIHFPGISSIGFSGQ